MFRLRLVILRSILSIVSQDAMHTLRSHRVYIHGIYQIKSFVCKGVTCKLCLQELDTQNWIICLVKCIIQIVYKKLKYVKFLTVYCCSIQKKLTDRRNGCQLRYELRYLIGTEVNYCL